MFKLIFAFAAAIAIAQAGLIVPTVTSQDSNIYRSYGNLGQVATSSKTISTPFSSVSKSDIRVSNPGYTVAAPVVSSLSYGSPALIASPYAAAPTVLHQPQHITTGGAGLLGVAYSVAPAVSHMTYSNGLGLQYAW